MTPADMPDNRVGHTVKPVTRNAGSPTLPNVAGRSSVHQLLAPQSAHTGRGASSRRGEEHGECGVRHELSAMPTERRSAVWLPSLS